MKEDSNLFIVADTGQNIVGFCMGYLCVKTGFKKHFVFNNFIVLAFKVLMLIASGNRIFYNRIVKSISSKKNSFSDETIVPDIYTSNQKGDLLSNCVEKSLRGTEVVAEMLLEYKN